MIQYLFLNKEGLDREKGVQKARYRPRVAVPQDR